MDCVEGGASVSFMAPFTEAEGEDFFRETIRGVQAGGSILLAAFLAGHPAGTVQILTARGNSGGLKRRSRFRAERVFPRPGFDPADHGAVLQSAGDHCYHRIVVEGRLRRS